MALTEHKVHREIQVFKVQQEPMALTEHKVHREIQVFKAQ